MLSTQRSIEKYLVVIPKDVRKALGIRIGETVEFVIEKGRAVLYPHRGSAASVRRIHGIIKHKGTIDEGIEEGYRAMGKHDIREIVTDDGHFDNVEGITRMDILL
ncbi:MAG: AbrB/MazE/SpoVT family DNA-binding domain-containing protein [Candidatus Methanoperedens sp.]|nr:AbrB/MazE/SpoVT family DNA-binding domain-containing protein [Candidatus Methanoperedens sp.]